LLSALDAILMLYRAANVVHRWRDKPTRGRTGHCRNSRSPKRLAYLLYGAESFL